MKRCGIALSLITLLLELPAALAAPLDKDSCDKLRTEQGELEHLGTRANMAKGPQWAKSSLQLADIDHIRRLIEVDGQLQFRCNGRPLVELPAENEATPADGAAAPAGKPPGGAAHKKAAAKHKAVPASGHARETPATAPVKEGDAAAVSRKASAEGAKVKAKAQQRPKPDDAYKPDDVYKPSAPDPAAGPPAPARKD